MHEWALAEAMVSAVLRAMREAGAKAVRGVEIAVGELQGLDEEAIGFALRELTRNGPLREAAWSFSKVGAKFRCRACGRKWKMESARENLTKEEAEAVHFVPEVVHAFLRCPSCGSPDFEITEGRGVWIKRVELST